VIPEVTMQGEVESTLEEWLPAATLTFDETADGLGIRQHRVERLQNGVWRSYPVEDPNTKTYWEITILVRQVEE
jgi:hypothetical protein